MYVRMFVSYQSCTSIHSQMISLKRETIRSFLEKFINVEKKVGFFYKKKLHWLDKCLDNDC